MKSDPLKLLIEAILKSIPKSKKPPSDPARKMKYPYTFTAKMVQFPWLYYIKNNWVYRYYFLSLILCFPIFKKIHNVMNSPTNVAKWKKYKARELEEYEEHERNLQ